MTVTAEPRTAIVGDSRSSCSVARRALLTLLVVGAILGTAAWFSRDMLLRSAARLWIVSDQLSSADAVAVFGGGLESRPFVAAALYRQGLVKKVLLSNVASSPAEGLGVLTSHVEANRQVLVKLGVAEADIETFGVDLSNTLDEATALRDWAERTGHYSFIVPTEIFSSRRVSWTLHRVFGDAGAIRVVALEPREYRRDNWWKSPNGLIGFQNEVVKYLYYRINY
jgi:uncharacterized SAM-binding protein YcdF (DUF218 family)